MRRIFNVIIVVLIAGSIVFSGFIARNTYKEKKIPAVFKEEKVASIIQKDYPEYVSGMDAINNIDIMPSKDHRSFEVMAQIDNSTEICSSSYDVFYSYELKKGKWKLENKNISDENVEWNLLGTIWTVQQNDEQQSFYQISFDSMSEVRITLKESYDANDEQSADWSDHNENVDEPNWNDGDDIEENDEEYFENDVTDENDMDEEGNGANLEQMPFSLDDEAKPLEENESGDAYTVTIERPDDTELSFNISKEEITLDLGYGGEKLILNKEQ